jgi:hypothetical protein
MKPTQGHEEDDVQQWPALKAWPPMPSRLALRLRAVTPLVKKARLLFLGPAGSGRGAAVAALAGDREMPLYRIDLSAIISKYIGETEKNLDRLVEETAAKGSVLLWLHAVEALAEVQLTVADLLRKVKGFPGPVFLTMETEPETLPETVTGTVDFRVDATA